VRADAKRNLSKIVEAAAEVIAEHGAAVPMSVVAARAGVGVGTLYRRFPDRPALLAAIGEYYIHHLRDALTVSSREPDAWQALRWYVAWVAAPGRSALAGALVDVPVDVVTSHPEFARHRTAWEEDLSTLVRRAQAEGDLRADVTVDDLIALLKLFTCSGAADDPVRHLHVLLDGMQAGAATPMPP
jgi:AcrR family transcriptional regulator